ncbi:MAG: hypothetical protein K1X88_27710 [Nannocystaceae bacterium]|nr:hypothetical protein [Nannocystaceae bacterium]
MDATEPTAHTDALEARAPVSLDALATTATLIIPPPAPPTPPPAPVAPPVARRLPALRELLADVGDAGTMPLAGPREDTDTRWAAVLLGWLVPEGLEALRRTDAGTRLLAAAPESAEETAVLVGAMVENPPLSAITTALLLGEWLDLRDLGPAVASACSIPTGQATRLVPSLLAWRDELRARGFGPRQVMEHLRARTAWMRGLSERSRDQLARLGVVTREAVLLLPLMTLRAQPGCRPETLREVERFRGALAEQPEIPTRAGKSRTTRRVPAGPRVAKAGALETLSVSRPIEAAAVPVEPTPVEPAAIEPAAIEPATIEVSASARHAVRLSARQLVAQRGCASLGALARACATVPDAALAPRALRQVLAEDPAVRSLEGEMAWFWIPEVGRNALLQRVAIASSGRELVDGARLRESLATDRTLARDLPPATVLAALAQQLREHAPPPAVEPVRDEVPVRVLTMPTPGGARPAIDDDTTVERLAELAGISVDTLVALALRASQEREQTQRRARRGRA